MKTLLLVLAIFTFVVSAEAQEITDNDILIVRSFESQLGHPALQSQLINNIFDVLSVFYEYKATEPPKDKNKMFLYENNPPTIDGFLDYMEHSFERTMSNADYFLDFDALRKKVKGDFAVLSWIYSLEYKIKGLQDNMNQAKKVYDKILLFKEFGKDDGEEKDGEKKTK